MYTIILVLSVTFILSLIFFSTHQDPYDDWFLVCLYSMLPTIFVAFFVVPSVLFVSAASYEDQKFSNPLVSLQDNDGVEGTFFLGSGRIESNPVFWYYTGSQGVYQLRSKPASQSTIVYSDSPPRVEWECEGYDWKNKWLLPPSCENPDKFTFYVPEGSIATGFDLDAKP